MEIQIQPIETDLIGKVIHFNETGFKSSLNFAERQLLPVVDEIKKTYENLQVLPPFSQSVWKQIQTDNGADVQRQYMQFVEKDATKFKTPSLREMARETAGEDLKPFFNAVVKLQSIQNPHNVQDAMNYGFDLVAIDEAGQPYIDEEPIREVYETKIINDQQAEFYRTTLRLIKEAENLRELLQGSKLDLSNQHWIDQGQGGLFETDRDGSLNLNPRAIRFL